MKLILFFLFYILSLSFPQVVNEPIIVPTKAQLTGKSSTNVAHEPIIVATKAQLTYDTPKPSQTGFLKKNSANELPAAPFQAQIASDSSNNYVHEPPIVPSKAQITYGSSTKNIVNEPLIVPSKAQITYGPSKNFASKSPIVPSNAQLTSGYSNGEVFEPPIVPSKAQITSSILNGEVFEPPIVPSKAQITTSSSNGEVFEPLIVPSKAQITSGSSNGEVFEPPIVPFKAQKTYSSSNGEVRKPPILPSPAQLTKSSSNGKVTEPCDSTLGKMWFNPAKSCIDIKTNGCNFKDGIFFLKNYKKQVFKAYCDMTIDGGGWTLFFAYAHNPNENYDLNSANFPFRPTKGRSHMNLNEAGFDESDVKELRFFCYSNHSRKFIHFTSKNVDLIKVALTGNQNHMMPNAFKENKINLKMPNDTKLSLMIQDKLPETTTKTNNNQKGGFWDTPFSSKEGAWSIKGNAKSGWIYECGDLLNQENGSKYETLHQVWFRGLPPTKDFLEARKKETKSNKAK